MKNVIWEGIRETVQRRNEDNMKMKEKKNILPGAIAAAFVAAVIVYIVLLNVEKNTLSAYEKGNVLTAQKDIAHGVVFTQENIPLYFEEVQMDIKLIPHAAVTDKDQLAGVLARTNIDQGCVITESMLDRQIGEISAMRRPVIAGFKAEDLFQVVSGILRTGDKIHIYTVDEEQEVAYLIWDNVLVQQVFDTAGSTIPAEDQTTAAARVNILLEQDSVEQFYAELAGGSLRVVKVYD